uniref:Secreted protein n=1 Tax=Elaeophora elaphi TaxID=1147741 RepID=A0A0R3RMQ7_9BILA
MSKLTLQKFGIYFLPWLLSIAVNCSSATALNRFYHFDSDGIVDEDGTPRWYFAKPALLIAKKQMSERVVNSLLRNAWIG